MRPAKAQANLCNRTVTPEPSLLVSSMDADKSHDQIFDVWLLEGMLVSKVILRRVKSGNFGHQVNSDIHLQTVKNQMRRLLMSRLIRIFTVC